MRGFASACMLLATVLIGAGRARAADAVPAAMPTDGALNEASTPSCVAGVCQVRLTPLQLLAQAEQLMHHHRYAEAKPLLEALAQAPQTRTKARFLYAMMAGESGNRRVAADIFKDLLADDPKQTAVRLELARTMLAMGDLGGADRQLRMAEQSGELPADVARAVRGARDVIRSRRAWRFDIDFGIAPDSNINNATAADTITVQLGDLTLPVMLDGAARAKSGTGLTGSMSTGLRLPVAKSTALLLDLDASGTNYDGRAYDDYSLQAAAGPQLTLSPGLTAYAETLAAKRWFGGTVASRQLGVRGGVQAALGRRTQIGVQIDSRHADVAFDRNYSGWQHGLYVNGERAVARTLIVNGGLFVRRDALRAQAFSSTEFGGSLGLGGELKWGVNFGVAANVSHARYDAPLALFSLNPREDWRYGARLTLGNRKLRLLGFSPQLSLAYTRTDSSIAYYRTDRLRLRFAVARYF